MALLVAVVLLLSVAGCTGLPEGGPIIETQVDSERDGERPMSIDPAPPRGGASAPDIAAGFLDAMEASPIRVDVARQFLSEGAKSTWDPERSTIVHGGLGSPSQIGSTVAAKTLGEVIIAGLQTNNTAFVLQGGLIVGAVAVLLYDGLSAIERVLARRTGLSQA